MANISTGGKNSEQTDQVTELAGPGNRLTRQFAAGYDPAADGGAIVANSRQNGGRVSRARDWLVTAVGLSKIRQSAPAIRDAFAAAVMAEQSHGLAFLLLPVALGLGAAIYYSLGHEPAWQILVVGLLLVALVACWQRKHAGRSAVIVAPFAMLLIGLLAGRYEVGKATILLDGRVTTTISGKVLEANIDAAGNVRYLLQVIGSDNPVIRRPPGRVRLVARADHPVFPIGSLIDGRAQLAPPSGPAFPGGYDFARNAFGQGIGAYGFFYSAPVASRATLQSTGYYEQLTAKISKLRAAISVRVRSAVPGDAGALIAALTVSDRGGISTSTVDSLRATGLAHILAISGLHMALAAGTFFVALRKFAAFSPRLVDNLPVKKYAAIGAILISTAYLVISGAGIPTRRAWLMMIIMFGAVILDRQALTMRNVALAALIIIAISPFSVVTPGFQMSFAATAALIAAYDAWSRRKKSRTAGTAGFLQSEGMIAGFIRFAGGVAMTSLVAGLATGLFAAYHFHQFAAYGLIANLLAMPLVTFLVMPMGLVAMLAMPFGLDYWPLQLMGQGLEGVVAIANHVNAMGGNMLTGLLPLWPTILAAGGFVALVFLRTGLRLLALVPLSLGLFLALPVFRPPPPDILISEDGRLVGLLGNKTISTNANRPGDFLFSQWQSAFLRPDHLPPVTLSKNDRAILVDSRDLLAMLIEMARQNPGRFICANRATCAAQTRGQMIVAIGDPAFMGAGCDLGDLVVLAAAIRRDTCYSGAKLVTARHLRRTGALAIRFSDNQAGSGRINHSDIQINAALDGIVRPWTIQRYFDWRSNRFEFPDNAAARAVLSVEDKKRIVGEVTEANFRTSVEVPAPTDEIRDWSLKTQ